MVTAVKTITNQVLETASDAIDELCGLQLTWREPGDQIAVLTEAMKLRSRLDAFICGAVAEVEQTGTAKDAGYRTVTQMVSDKTGANPDQTRADLRLGRWLRDLGEFAEAFNAGLILREHLDLIRRTCSKPHTFEQLRRDQALFIEWAADYDFVDYKNICLYWVNANDPDGQLPKEQTRKTFFKPKKNADGSANLTGFLDPLTAEAFFTAWQHEDQKLFRSGQETTEAGPLSPDHAAPSPGKRGANALMNLIVRGFKREDGTHPVPLINIVASEAVIEDTIERLDDLTLDPLPLAFDDIDKRCELIDGTPLHPTYLLTTLGLATFRRQILSAAGRSLDVSVNARCFTPWQQQALRVEARGRCQDPGCHSPFPWLEADHIVAHSRGGPTQMSNGKMRCGPHNRAKGDRPERPAA